MNPPDFEKAKKAVHSLGSDHQVRSIIYEIESVEIYHTYYRQLEQRPGESSRICRELAHRFNRSEKSIQYVLYR